MLRIAVIRLSSLGDVLLMTPLLRQLRYRFSEAEVVVVVRRQYQEVVMYNPRVTAVVPYEAEGAFWQAGRERRRLREGLRNPREELWIIDLHRNWRSWYLRWGSRARLFRAPKQRWRKTLLLWAKRWGWWELLPVPERYRRAVAALGVREDGEGLECWLPEERTARVYPPTLRRLPSDFQRIALIPGARHVTKRWMSDSFIALGRLLSQRGCEVVLIGEPSAGAEARLMAKAIGSVRELVVTPSLLELARVLDSVDVAVGNDSGVLHLAAARRTPVVVLFGSTVPELGFRPFGVLHEVVQYPLPCRPCTHIGRERCPLGHFHCMKLLQPHHVLHALEILREHIRAQHGKIQAPWGPTLGSGARWRT